MEEISVLGRKWKYKSPDERRVYSIINGFSLSELEARLIASRGISDDEIINFLNPKIKNIFPDPFSFKDMQKAVDRVVTAILNCEKITIFGDYDVDGATSSALLKRYLTKLGCYSDIYIPDRITEGYGPSIGAMDKFKNNGTKLVFTLDCGVTSFEPVSYASKIGLDVIVIDHHMGVDKLPDAYAVVNPNRLDEENSYQNLAAVGVTFIFVAGLQKRLEEINFFENDKKSNKKISKPNLMDYLDLVALGTVCDVMTLTGLNRAFVTQGLKILSNSKNIGLKTLSEIASINEKISTYHLGFVLGPRINAGGRVGKSYLGAELLSTDSSEKALEYATELEFFNDERKRIEAEVIEEAIEQSELQKHNNAIIVSSEKWHIGVIGIIAGKIKEKYQKPAAVISFDGEIGKASCRSIQGFNFGAKILDAKFNNLIIEGGGHSAAAGFTIHKNNLEEFKKFINDEIEKEKEKILENMFFSYDISLNSKSINFDTINSIEKLSPFGNGNFEPIVKISGLYVLRANLIANKHISLLLANDKKSSYGSGVIKAISFNSFGTEIGDVLLSNYPHTLTVYGNLRVNKWQNSENIQLQLMDIKI